MHQLHFIKYLQSHAFLYVDTCAQLWITCHKMTRACSWYLFTSVPLSFPWRDTIFYFDESCQEIVDSAFPPSFINPKMWLQSNRYHFPRVPWKRKTTKQVSWLWRILNKSLAKELWRHFFCWSWVGAFVFWSGCQNSLREAESGARLRALEMKSCVNDRGNLIKPEYLNDCRK